MFEQAAIDENGCQQSGARLTANQQTNNRVTRQMTLLGFISISMPAQGPLMINIHVLIDLENNMGYSQR